MILLIFLPTVFIVIYALSRAMVSESLIKQKTETVIKTETIKEVLLNIIKVLGVFSFVPFLAPYVPGLIDVMNYIGVNIDVTLEAAVLIWNILLGLWSKLRLISNAAKIRAARIDSNDFTASL
jgi:hypothetical protein